MLSIYNFKLKTTHVYRLQNVADFLAKMYATGKIIIIIIIIFIILIITHHHHHHNNNHHYVYYYQTRTEKYMTQLAVGWTLSSLPQVVTVLFASPLPRSTLGPSQHPILWLTDAISTTVKRPEQEIDVSPNTSTHRYNIVWCTATWAKRYWFNTCRTQGKMLVLLSRFILGFKGTRTHCGRTLG